METTDARWLGATWTGDGNDQVRFCIQTSLPASRCASTLPKSARSRSSATFTATADARTFSCTAATYQASQKKRGCFPSCSHASVLSSFTTTPGSETKNQRSQQPEWPFLTKWSAKPSTQSSLRFAVTTQDPLKTTTSAPATWCRQEETFAELWSCTFRFLCRRTSRTTFWKTFKINTITTSWWLTRASLKTLMRPKSWKSTSTNSKRSDSKAKKSRRNTSKRGCLLSYDKLQTYSPTDIPLAV